MLRSALLFHYLTAAHELRLDRGFTLSSSLGTWSTLEALKRQHHLLNGNLLNKKEFNEHTLSHSTHVRHTRYQKNKETANSLKCSKPSRKCQLQLISNVKDWSRKKRGRCGKGMRVCGRGRDWEDKRT